MFFWTRKKLIDKTVPFVEYALISIKFVYGELPFNIMINPILIGYLYHLSVYHSDKIYAKPISYDEELLVAKNCIMRAYNMHGMKNISNLFGLVDALKNDEVFNLGRSLAQEAIFTANRDNNSSLIYSHIYEYLKDEGFL